jgi:hypothetical protein
MGARCGELKDGGLGSITRELEPTWAAGGGGARFQRRRQIMYKKCFLEKEGG